MHAPLAIVLAILCLAGPVHADWPMFRADPARSGVALDTLPPTTAQGALRHAWTWRSTQRPRPAWPGPAKWDAYARIKDLKSMRNYDPVFHAVAVDDWVCFASSADDSVHLLDAATGKPRWTFTTGGPVRVAPTFSEGKLYFGSDDGHAYCVDAATGELVWKFSPWLHDHQNTPEHQRPRLLLNNTRLIPFWPVRTGVVVVNDTAYFAASLLPWKNSYLAAVDARTGRPEGEGRYVREVGDSLTLEGPMLASANSLVLPQGRVAPIVFDRATGGSQGMLSGGGGSFVLLTDDDRILHGPGNKQGWVTNSDAQTKAKIASYNRGHEMLVDADRAFLLQDGALTAMHRAEKRLLWNAQTEHAYAMIKSADTIYLGGYDSVAARHADDGSLLWSAPVDGRAYGLAVANGRLIVSTDRGAIHAFHHGPERATDAENLSREPILNEHAAFDPDLPKAKPAAGPLLRFVDATTAEIRWWTAAPSPSRVFFWRSAEPVLLGDPTPKTEHRVLIPNLREQVEYSYVIQHVPAEDAGLAQTGYLLCDTTFNYHPDHTANADDDSAASPAVKAAASALLDAQPARRGVAVCLGLTDASLCLEIARNSDLTVIALERDDRRVAAARAALLAAGFYGSRVAVHDTDELPIASLPQHFATLVFSERDPAGLVPAAQRGLAQSLLAPVTGVAAVATNTASPSLLTKPPFDGAADWTHMYGPADNAAFAGETLAGAKHIDDLEVQWLGRPGPRYQSDRGNRKPAPLAAAGRLFMQGLRRAIALDAYNGAILWALEIPDFVRFNIPRDAGNWTADDQHVFLAVRDELWRVDAATGQLLARHAVLPGSTDTWNPRWDWDWGYVAREGDLIIGSAVKAGSAYTAFWGGEAWYDTMGPESTAKVSSDRLFALTNNQNNPELAWSYADGVVINPTLTIHDGALYFLEMRHPDVKQSDDRRVHAESMWQGQFLVALDAATGRKLWERQVDVTDGVIACYMAASQGRLVITTSAEGKFGVHAFDAATGSPLWNKDVVWETDHHGKHLSRPAIARGKIILRPYTLSLDDGAEIDNPFPGGHQCGTYTLSTNAAFLRAGELAMWNLQDKSASRFTRVRPDCWISTIPAQGMVLSPEGGGGCSCGSWMETSMALIPKAWEQR